MGRPPLPAGHKRVQHSIRLDPELEAWVAQEIAARRFKDFTHAVEFALARLRDQE